MMMGSSFDTAMGEKHSPLFLARVAITIPGLCELRGEYHPEFILGALRKCLEKALVVPSIKPFLESDGVNKALPIVTQHFETEAVYEYLLWVLKRYFGPTQLELADISFGPVDDSILIEFRRLDH